MEGAMGMLNGHWTVMLGVLVLLAGLFGSASGQEKKPPAYLKTWKVDMPVLDRLVDINVGETKPVELSNGRTVTVKLLEIMQDSLIIAK